MHEPILSSGRDTLLVAIPFVMMLFLSMFRLDEVLATPRGALNRRRPAPGLDEKGEPVLRDPDGSLSDRGQRR
jgi:hypothetical protein